MDDKTKRALAKIEEDAAKKAEEIRKQIAKVKEAKKEQIISIKESAVDTALSDLEKREKKVKIESSVKVEAGVETFAKAVAPLLGSLGKKAFTSVISKWGPFLKESLSKTTGIFAIVTFSSIVNNNTRARMEYNRKKDAVEQAAERKIAALHDKLDAIEEERKRKREAILRTASTDNFPDSDFEFPANESVLSIEASLNSVDSACASAFRKA